MLGDWVKIVIGVGLGYSSVYRCPLLGPFNPAIDVVKS